MLILSRRPSESLIISDDIIVTVLRVEGNQVKIGIEAPKQVTVHRDEVYRRIMLQPCQTIVPACIHGSPRSPIQSLLKLFRL